MRRQGYKPNHLVAGREAWMRCCSEARVCVQLHKFRLSCPPWTDTDKQIAGALLQSPLSFLSLKNISKKGWWQFWIIVWMHWERSTKLVMLCPAHCTFKCPVKFPLHRKPSLGRIVLHTVEVRSWREVDAVFQVFNVMISTQKQLTCVLQPADTGAVC